MTDRPDLALWSLWSKNRKEEIEGVYALELRFKAARSTVDIDLAMGRMSNALTQGRDVNEVVREVLQVAASLDLGDWFEYTIGPVIMDITAAPYGGARYPVDLSAAEDASFT